MIVPLNATTISRPKQREGHVHLDVAVVVPGVVLGQT